MARARWIGHWIGALSSAGVVGGAYAAVGLEEHDEQGAAQA